MRRFGVLLCLIIAILAPLRTRAQDAQSSGADNPYANVKRSGAGASNNAETAAQASSGSGFTWMLKSSFNDPRTTTGVEGAAASLINGKIYVSHGYRGGDGAFLSIYDVASDTWTHGGTTAPNGSVPRSELAGATALGKHYAIGGRTGPTAANEQFDPATNTWTTKAPMSIARGGVGAASFNDKIYAIGGRDGGTYGTGSIFNLNEVYDPTTDKWTTLAPLPTAVSDDYATVALNGKIYVFGGTTGGNAGLTSLVQIYDIASNTWSTGAPMPTPRGAAMAGVIAGQIAVFGGVDANTADLAVTEIYDPTTNTWSTGPNMLKATSEIAQGVVSDGTQVFAIGMGIFGVSGMEVQALVAPTPAFMLTPGGGTTATVHPGDTAVFPLTLTPVAGFTGTVTLSCASQQPTITCSISPTTVNLVAGGTAAAISVNTFCAWLAPRFAPPGGIPGPWLPSLSALMALALIVAVTGLSRRKLRPSFAIAALALFAMLGAGCASLQHGPAGATPPGTYNLVVTASAPGSAPQTIPLTLKVI